MDPLATQVVARVFDLVQQLLELGTIMGLALVATRNGYNLRVQHGTTKATMEVAKKQAYLNRTQPIPSPTKGIEGNKRKKTPSKVAMHDRADERDRSHLFTNWSREEITVVTALLIREMARLESPLDDKSAEMLGSRITSDTRTQSVPGRSRRTKNRSGRSKAKKSRTRN